MNEDARKRLAEIYLKAAVIVSKDQGEPSCWAIDIAADDNYSRARHAYVRFILDEREFVSDLWGKGNEYTKQTQNARVLLLCFAAQLALTGDME